MFGIVTPPPKITVLHKCRDCGNKCRLLEAVLLKKCPVCSGSRLKLSLGMVEYNPSGPIVY